MGIVCLIQGGQDRLGATSPLVFRGGNVAEPIAEVGYLAGACQYDGTAWRKSNLLWGYNDRYVEKISNLSATGPLDYLTSTPVPAGYVYVISMASAWNDITDCDLVWLQVTDGTTYVTFKQETFPGVGIAVVWNGEIVLKEGDFVRAGFYITVAGDDIFLCVWGYKMKLDM